MLYRDFNRIETYKKNVILIFIKRFLITVFNGIRQFLALVLAILNLLTLSYYEGFKFYLYFLFG